MGTRCIIINSVESSLISYTVLIVLGFPQETALAEEISTLIS